ncbi:MAG: hypothetical protein ACK4GN_12575 [Runella sp.]
MAIAILVLAIVLVVYGLYNGRDRHKGYQLSLDIPLPTEYTAYKTGFAAVKITPTDFEPWVDKDNNAAYEPDKGDTFQDLNNNGVFDTYWIAGFDNKRAVNGIHDDLWARTALIDDGKTRLAVVSLDLIGFPHKNVLNVRKKLPAEWGITYLTICTTHNHEGPDMLGMWGDSELKSGVNKAYEKRVESMVLRSIEQALKNLKLSKLTVAQDLTYAQALTTDTRKPIVKDDGLYILRASDPTTNVTFGTLVVWGNHPETLWNKNTLLTSDFPHYLREGIEKGVYDGNTLVQKGIGGTVVYATGCVGGLMTTDPTVKVKDPFKENVEYEKPSFEKAEAQGKALAMMILKALEKEEAVEGGIRLVAKTLDLPLDNWRFRLAVALGIIDAGYSRWRHFRTEVAAWQIGNVSFVTIPGEIYPEIVNGGIETPSEGDFQLTTPIETPPIRSLMPGRYKFVLGLANDELGYIIPKSEWDEKPPYLYGAQKQLYGEINSVGPETAPILHQNIKTMLEQLSSK